MMNRDEKGRISPAQSKVAKAMGGRSTPLGARTMTQIAEKHGPRIGKHAFGERHHGLAGMDRMASLKEANKGKKAKSRVVLRGQKSEYRKSYTKHGARMHKTGALKVPAGA